METTITALPTASGIDATTDWIAIDRTSLSTTQKINRNTYLGITGSPVGNTDVQTLTNKTITAPAISSPVLSGTITGTYTIGGTPTFPSSVVTLAGSQTLTNKVLTSPTINGGTIDNSTVTVDAIAGHTSSTSGTIYGIAVTSSKISGTTISNGTITSTQIATNGVAASNLATNAITLGYTQITAAVTSSTTSAWQDAGTLTATVTVPSGSRRVKVTFFATAIQSSVATGIVAVAINKDGTVVQQWYFNGATGNSNFPSTIMYVDTPTAASHTYKIQFAGDGTHTTTINAGNAGSTVFTSGPAFILVEAI